MRPHPTAALLLVCVLATAGCAGFVYEREGTPVQSGAAVVDDDPALDDPGINDAGIAGDERGGL